MRCHDQQGQRSRTKSVLNNEANFAHCMELKRQCYSWGLGGGGLPTKFCSYFNKSSSLDIHTAFIKENVIVTVLY